MKNRNPHKASIWFAGPTVTFVAAVLLIVSLLLFFLVIPTVVRALILKETRLLNGTDTWKKWTDVKVPILIKFNIFNVTNIEEAEDGGKFKLQDVGPYVWEEKRSKQIVSIDEEEDTVTYREVVQYYFRRDLSVGSQEDTVNIVNIPFLAASALTYKTLYSTLADYVINFFVNMDEKFVLRDVNIRELVFDGVKLGDTYSNLADFGVVELPEEFIDGTFAFYNQKNGTPTKEFKVYRGMKNSEDFGKIVEFDHKKEVSFWTNHSLPADAQQYCNKINGTDGSLVAPFVTKDREIQIFPYEICRSIYLHFNQELTFKGIPAYQFIIPDQLLADPHSNPDNQCFCPDPEFGVPNTCEGSGAYRMASCKRGIPLGLSLPHFLRAAPRYHEGVEGMKPEEEKHVTEMILEPNSGAILRVVKRVQISTELVRFPGITAFSHVKEAIVPIFWVEERADLDDHDISDIRDRLVAPLETLRLWKPIVFGVLALSLLSGIFMSLYEMYFIRARRVECFSILQL